MKMYNNVGRIEAFAGLIILMLLSGCVGNAAEDDDPLQGVNRVIYNINDSLDKAVIKPVATAYSKVTPKGVRMGVTNFFDNVSYINVIANDVLQGKFQQAANDTGRFLLNSTVGFGGLFDVASGAGLPKNDEDLGQTFGKWGAGEGAYLVLPIFGPNSVRDAPDLATSTVLNPLFYVSTTVTLPLGIVNGINKRANLLEATRIRDEAALDAYSFTREAYRQNREYRIYDGNPPTKDLEYIEEEDGVLKVY
ncbi:MAG: MlaA family lipoprotein [Chromatiales bacterium]